MTVFQQATSTEVPKSILNRARYVVPAVLLALSVGLWLTPLLADFWLARSSDANTYILLIIPLSVSLIYLERSGVVAGSPKNHRIGAILLAVAITLRASTEWNFWHLSSSANLSVSIGGLVVWWIGTAIFCFGLQTVRSLLLPICFLFLIVPLPDRAVTWITAFLQQQSASAASMLFGLAGVPVAHDGVILSIPGLTIEVAHECSSIRSSTILVVMTVLLAHLFLRSAWRKAVLVLASIPLSIAKNAIRIFTIAELGTRVNPSFLHGNLHRHGGVVFLSLAVAMTIVLLWILRKSETTAGFPFRRPRTGGRQ